MDQPEDDGYGLVMPFVVCQTNGGPYDDADPNPKGQPMPTTWRKSSRCDSSACVETTPHLGGMAMRDSKHPDNPHLTFNRKSWNDFIHAIKNGQLG